MLLDLRNSRLTIPSGMHRLNLYKLQTEALERWAKKETPVATECVVEEPKRVAPVRKKRRAPAPAKPRLTASRPSAPLLPLRQPAPAEPTVYDWMRGVIPLPIYNATCCSLFVLRNLTVTVAVEAKRSVRRLLAAFLLMAA